jgi:hypothetical protein
MAHDFVEKIETLAVADEATASASFQVPKWAVFCGVWLVNHDAADVGIQICDTTGGTFVPILDPADGADLVILASGSDPGCIDISDFIRFVPSTYFLQLTFSAAQNTGPYTHKLFFRG